jgi:hypothetical protein
MFKLWLVGCLGFEPRLLGRKFNFATIRRFGEASTPEGDAGRAPSLHLFMPWHLSYNLGIITGKPQSGHAATW